ncbi:hypothetical protein JTE90_010428 [Oedothorax gibbosus]|uniref:Uncharacterized protein n=1 Tax=Oedothorax gibbosus TaxID=931172 RepID=A0AAV6VZG0_9ARAC|nr:hypothetical protein JTE90_010428 [Oedothorax gibbosus]
MSWDVYRMSVDCLISLAADAIASFALVQDINAQHNAWLELFFNFDFALGMGLISPIASLLLLYLLRFFANYSPVLSDVIPSTLFFVNRVNLTVWSNRMLSALPFWYSKTKYSQLGKPDITLAVDVTPSALPTVCKSSTPKFTVVAVSLTSSLHFRVESWQNCSSSTTSIQRFQQNYQQYE